MENEQETKILVIEDNEIFRDILIDKVRSQGYKTVFLDSNATVDEVKNENPNLAIINITTPAQKGIKLIKEMSQYDGLSNIPVMAIAKTEGSVIVDHARKYGVEYTIDRTIFDADEMLENIAQLLNPSAETVVSGEKEEILVKKEREAVSSDNTKGNVLLLEDDVFMRNLFSENLEEAGFGVRSAEDAAIALEMLQEFLPDVVLLDLLLPGKSGFQFLSDLKASEEHAHIPVIVVSNLGSKGDIDRALDMGAVDFLVKANATIDEIIEKTEEHIKKSKSKPKLPESVLNDE